MIPVRWVNLKEIKWRIKWWIWVLLLTNNVSDEDSVLFPETRFWPQSEVFSGLKEFIFTNIFEIKLEMHGSFHNIVNIILHIYVFIFFLRVQWLVNYSCKYIILYHKLKLVSTDVLLNCQGKFLVINFNAYFSVCPPVTQIAFNTFLRGGGLRHSHCGCTCGVARAGITMPLGCKRITKAKTLYVV
jgi:hypothetical protein